MNSADGQRLFVESADLAYPIHEVNLQYTVPLSARSLRQPHPPSDNPESAPLKQVADVPLPGPAVRFDYQSIDPSHGRLYIAHMNADQLVVFDTKKREVVANLDGFPNVLGV
jgi:hypothetical protein